MIEGIYAAYFAGAGGNGMGMFVFLNGVIAGADISGLNFEGNYEATDDGFIVGTVNYEMPPNSASVTGAVAKDRPIAISVPIKLPQDIDPDETYRLETPIGPLSARFKKLRALL